MCSASLTRSSPSRSLSAAPLGGAWRGSDNQPLLLLTARAQDRYAVSEKVAPAVQLAEADGGLYVIGIPKRGDLALLEQRLSDRGIALQGASWR